MSQNEAIFEVGDRVVYVGFGMSVPGVVTEVKIEPPKYEGVERRRFRIATDTGGILTKITSHLRRAQ
jgi:hypothetical protein